jgi:hypothetical protein
MRQISKRLAVKIVALTAAIVVPGGGAAWRSAWAQSIRGVDARLIAINVPGASAMAQVGTFLNNPAACARPIPTLFPSYIQPGAVLDPVRSPRVSGRKAPSFLSTRPAQVS